MGTHRRHDLSDETWQLLEPHLPGTRGQQGRPAQDNRRFLNAVFWILRTGAPWRDLPPDYGDWKNVHRRFCRWRDKGIWETLFHLLMEEPEYQWLIMETSQAGGDKGRRSGYGRRRRGLNPTIHLAVAAPGMPIRGLVAEGARADCQQACQCMKDIPSP
ncbi:MAG: IS5 family transposase [Oscillatoriales cyanobacterium SM2_1_8]|nr:IS5 family transposase [Oscillatoriales cyanobacterium SM2_1_8]